MRILLSAHAFYPSVGGIETIAAMLASEFVDRGEEVQVVTQSAAKETTPFPYRIVRRASPVELIRLVRWSEVVLQVNISLRTGWPLFSRVRPWVISHHTWIPGGLRGFLKRRCSRVARNIAVSHAIAKSLEAPCAVIPNAYDHDVFREIPGVPRERDLVFVGRLVSDKGVECALTALRLLKEKGITPTFTVIGAGPEEARVRHLASEFEIADQLRFTGVRRGEELARELSRHKIMLIPSLWEEPFGIVALEGIACGCVIVGSNRGGLPEAIGACGMIFPNGDACALARCLAELHSKNEKLSNYRQQASAHLARFHKPFIAQRYLDVLKLAVNSFQRTSAAGRLQKDQC